MSVSTGLRAGTLPFLTLPDPLVPGEGALDPLGLAPVGERLADWVLPGMTARMSRPRFLTAIALSAQLCRGLEQETACDGVTPAYLVFEWLVVEGFARTAERADAQRTPGIEKARTCCRAGDRMMCARTYLKAPTVFGFHGVYRRLARHVSLIDHYDLLAESGYRLLKVWEHEQGLEGFLESAGAATRASSDLQLLRSAITDSLHAGYADRSAAWAGWSFVSRHLVPAKPGKREAQFLWELLLDEQAETRGEVFRLLEKPKNVGFVEGHTEAAVMHLLLPQASHALAPRFEAIIAYEEFCALLETGFDLLRWLSSRAGARSVSPREFAGEAEAQRCAASLPTRLEGVERALDAAPRPARTDFSELARYFEAVTDSSAFCQALLLRHADVQKGKPPEGKRRWFEESENGGIFVRPPYRVDEPPPARDGWPRPYRLGAAFSFCRDLKLA